MTQSVAEHLPDTLGQWGTMPGRNFSYAHLRRAIVARDLDIVAELCQDTLAVHSVYVLKRHEDVPQIRDRSWLR